MRYAYDLDGTLAYTRQAVLLAYRGVGVEPPEDFFGKPWGEWLDSAELHRKKNELYAKIASDYVKPTNLCHTYKLTGGIIITGASYPAACTVLSIIGINPSECHLFCELGAAQKADILNSYGNDGIVFEDSIKIATYLAKETRWTVCHVL